MKKKEKIPKWNRFGTAYALQFRKAALLLFLFYSFAAAAFCPFFGIFFSVTVSVCFFALNLLLYAKSRMQKKMPFLCYFLAAAFAVFTGLNLCAALSALAAQAQWKSVLLGISLCGICFLFLNALAAAVYGRIHKDKGRVYTLIPLFVFLLFILVFLPTELMIQNNNDYLISYGEYIYPNVVCFLVMAVLLACVRIWMPMKAAVWLARLDSGIFLCAYLQYLFLNRKLGMLDGTSYSVKEHMALTIWNLLFWIVILVTFLWISGRNHKYSRNFPLFVSGFSGMLLLAAFVFNLVKAPDYAFEMSEYDIDTSGQYTVSSKQNVILFVLDAVDNSYIRKIYEENPDYFVDFADYTMYTNTCSVYDLTSTSLPQMMSGSDFDGKQADYGAFYNRLHDNGFIINFYNYESTKDSIDIRSYLDNYIKADVSNLEYHVDYISIVQNTLKLSGYIALPYAVKSLVKPDTINFTSQVYFDERDGTAVNYIGKRANVSNADFAAGLSLKVDDKAEGYFIMQHVEGAHAPQDDYIEATYESLDLVKKYMLQLKGLGLYEDTAIIVTADHGLHDDAEPYQFPTAATPVLMVKEAGSKETRMKLTDAPVYHTDFLKTILQLTDLYEEEDGDRFGKAFTDFSEHELRRRTWYDTAFQLADWDYYAYEFTGTTEDLEKAVEEGRYTLVRQ